MFYFPDLICAGGKVSEKYEYPAGLARSTPSALPRLWPGTVHNKLEYAGICWNRLE